MRYIIYRSLFLCSILLFSIILYSVSNLKNIDVISNVLSADEELPSQKKSNSNSLTLSDEEHDYVFNLFNVNFFSHINEMEMGYLLKKVTPAFVEIIAPPPLW